MENEPDREANSKMGQHNSFRILWGNVDGFGKGWYWTRHKTAIVPSNHPHGPFFTSEECYDDYNSKAETRD